MPPLRCLYKCYLQASRGYVAFKPSESQLQQAADYYAPDPIPDGFTHLCDYHRRCPPPRLNVRVHLLPHLNLFEAW